MGLASGLLGAFLVTPPGLGAPADSVKKDFLDAQVCGGCHGVIYEEWNGSLHSLATRDPIYMRAAKLFLSQAKNPGELAEAESCVKCHAPLAVVAGKIEGVSGEITGLEGVLAQGVSCDFCHSVEKALGIGNAQYGIAPAPARGGPGAKFGPRRDSESPFHGTSFSALHRSAEFCGMCHDVSHVANLLPIERTYTEWVSSPYNTGEVATSVICQHCHMRQSEGTPATGMTERPRRPGKAAVMGPEREHVATHVFVGANTVVPKLLGFERHATMAAERLKNAARLELSAAEAVPGGVARLSARVWNEGAGHYLPTGLTEVREMWLQVVVEDSAGTEVFVTGRPDRRGDLPPDARVFHTILGTPQGEPTMNIALADRVLHDKRVPPKGYVEEEFAFLVPADAERPLTARVTLRYRTASQKVARLLFGEDAPEIPIVDMARAELTLR